MITIRKFENKDATRLVELLNYEEVSRWTSNIPFPYTLQDAYSWFASSAGQSGRCPYAVEQGGELVACVSYWPTQELEYEIAYWVGKEYWGKNIASTALLLLINHDDFPKCKKLVARVMLGNIRSEKVLLKNGFVFVDNCKIKKHGKIIDGKYFEKEIAC